MSEELPAAGAGREAVPVSRAVSGGALVLSRPVSLPPSVGGAGRVVFVGCGCGLAGSAASEVSGAGPVVERGARRLELDGLHVLHVDGHLAAPPARAAADEDGELLVAERDDLAADDLAVLHADHVAERDDARGQHERERGQRRAGETSNFHETPPETNGESVFEEDI